MASRSPKKKSGSRPQPAQKKPARTSPPRKSLGRVTNAVLLTVALAVALGWAYQLWASTPKPPAPTAPYETVRTSLPHADLPGAYRSATPLLVEVATQVRTGLSTSASGFADAARDTKYALLGVLLALTFAATVLLVGADALWAYLALLLVAHAVSKPLTVVPPPPAPMFVWLRFTDYPSLLATTIVFGLVGLYYVRGPVVLESRARTGLWLSGIALAAAAGAFVRESVLMCAVFAGCVTALEAVRFALQARQRTPARPWDFAGLWRAALDHPFGRALGALAAVGVGMALGRLLMFVVFPEVLQLKWQVLPGFTTGGLWQDAAYYRPANLARTSEIVEMLWSQFGLFMIVGLLAPVLVRTPAARFLAIAVALTFIAHFTSYYLFGGLIHEFYGIGVLIAGLCVPLGIALAEGLPSPWGRWTRPA